MRKKIEHDSDSSGDSEDFEEIETACHRHNPIPRDEDNRTWRRHFANQVAQALRASARIDRRKDETGTVPFRIRLGTVAKAALDKEAKAQGRPSANLAQWTLVEWLREKGLLNISPEHAPGGIRG